MSSDALLTFRESLCDVDEIINGHTALTGGGVGKPAQKQGQALTRSGVVLLCAAVEVFFEDLFREAAKLIYSTASEDELKRLFNSTADRLNHPSLHSVTVMYFSIGMNHPFSGIRWKKMSNQMFTNHFNNFTDMRGRIAHGRRPTVTLPRLRAWKKTMEHMAIILENIVAEHIEKHTGVRPEWNM